jgi:two-component system sensor histidine kinase RegB
LIADRVLGLVFNTELCFLVIAAAVIANLLAMFLFPENKRLGETAVTAMLIFDVAQLCFLLFLTGGLHNPFAVMVLAPVAVGAAALKLRSILVLVVVTLVLITFVGLYHQPIRMAEGFILRLPRIFVQGFWGAIFAGTVFVALLIRRVSEETHSMGDALLATQMALAREQKLTDLGGVVAAAAHELGTPLAGSCRGSSRTAPEQGKAGAFLSRSARCRKSTAAGHQSRPGYYSRDPEPGSERGGLCRGKHLDRCHLVRRRNHCQDFG